MVFAAPLFLIAQTRSARAWVRSNADALRNVGAGFFVSYLALRMLSKVYEHEITLEKLQMAKEVHARVVADLADREWVRSHVITHALRREAGAEATTARTTAQTDRLGSSARVSTDASTAAAAEQDDSGYTASTPPRSRRAAAVIAVCAAIADRVRASTRAVEADAAARASEHSLAWRALAGLQNLRVGAPAEPEAVVSSTATPAAPLPTPPRVPAVPLPPAAVSSPATPPAVAPLPRSTLI